MAAAVENITITAPNGEHVKVGFLSWLTGDKIGDKGEVTQWRVCVDQRNRVLCTYQAPIFEDSKNDGAQGAADQVATAVSETFEYYAALDDIDYFQYGFSRKGVIWYDPQSQTATAEAERIKKAVAAQIAQAKGEVCTIL